MKSAIKRGYRSDIQALRACAVLAVVLFHMGAPVIDGGFVGVDIFFVISGFLITRQLVEEHDRTGSVSFRGFYGRRIRRLLPLASVVLFVTLVAAALLYSPFELSGVATDAGWTAAYLANYRFALSGQDYFAIIPSPLVHYWSLAVEEQFYVVWPALLALLLTRRRWLRTAIAVLLVVSFVHSFLESSAHPSFAYYSITTRAWQLLAGALVAVTVPRGLGGLGGTAAESGRHLPEQAGSVLRTAGVLTGFAVLLGSVVLINQTDAYPGTAAAFPVLGTVLILVMAPGSSAWLDKLLSLAPIALIGELSYGWYLWHWPLIIFGERLIANDSSVRVAAGVLSFGLAWATYHLVEKPLRFGPLMKVPWRAVLAGGVAATVVIATSAAVYGYNEHRLSQPRLKALDQALHGASPAGPDCFSPDVKALLENCSGGDPNGPRLVIAGDSNARMWYPAFLELAKKMGFQAVLYSGNGCNVLGFRAEVLVKDCKTYSQGLDKTMTALDPDAVVFTHLGGTKIRKLKGAWLTRLRSFVDAREKQGATVGSIDNVPAARFDVEDCLLAHQSDYSPCNVPERRAMRGPAAWTAFQAPVLNALDVTQLDPSTFICRNEICPIESPGGVITFRDSGHITGLYAAEVAPELTDFVRELLPDLAKPGS